MNIMARNLRQDDQACPVDLFILGSSALLLLIGWVMVTSASSEIAARNFGNPFWYTGRHGLYIFIGLLTGAIALMLPIRVWQRSGWALLLLSFFLLVTVLVPGLGREVNGAVRWLPLGIFNLQGSEFVKLFSVVFFAAYIVNPDNRVNDSFVCFAKPLALISLLLVLLLVQPDFGASVVIITAVIGVLFFSGAPMRFFAPTVLSGSAIVALLVVMKPYRLARILTFTDPWKHPFDGGYQLTQALIAFGRGEWFGLGLGNSVQKLFFLPEAHTDFLFSIIAEELGIVGGFVILAGFSVLVIKTLLLGKRAYQIELPFHGGLATGIGVLFGAQALINLGVNLGLLPTKGLTLPLMSYGGNSLIVSCLLVALLLRIDMEVKHQMKIYPARRNFRDARR
ncbi:MAG: putative lipid II flippase FtsW [Pseudomonadota bacterium]|nr:putative lipid II flippase FtsW [Pseudomonadota bacterium]